MEKSVLQRPLLVGTSCPTPSDLRFGIIHRLLPISDRGNLKFYQHPLPYSYEIQGDPYGIHHNLLIHKFVSKAVTISQLNRASNSVLLLSKQQQQQIFHINFTKKIIINTTSAIIPPSLLSNFFLRKFKKKSIEIKIMHEHLETLHEEEGPKHQQQATTTWNKRNLGHTSSSDGKFFFSKIFSILVEDTSKMI